MKYVMFAIITILSCFGMLLVAFGGNRMNDRVAIASALLLIVSIIAAWAVLLYLLV